MTLHRDERTARPYARGTSQAPCRRLLCGLTLIYGLTLLAVAQPAWALTPESPEVKAAVQKGIDALVKKYKDDERTGAMALVGLALIKTDAPPTHPVVLAAIAKVRSSLGRSDGDFHESEAVYNIGISTIFFANLPAEHRADLQKLTQLLLSRQMPRGGWGYPGAQMGDNSMTQYGALGMWEAYRAGIEVSLPAFEKCCNWLLSVQDPSGGFGYQGVETTSAKLEEQQEIKHSLCAAAMGGLYICVDHFDFGGAQLTAGGKPAGGLPPAVKQVSTGEKRRAKRRSAAVNEAKLRAATKLGDTWFEKNQTMTPTGWKHYFLYAYERYKSFKEEADKSTDKGIDKEPAWYTDWAKDLISTQSPDGTWAGQAGVVPDTAFSVLFLIRSTKKSIASAALGSGALVGNRGLPKDLANIQVKYGTIVPKPLAGPADDLLKVMEDHNHPDYLRAVAAFSQKALETDIALISRQKTRLLKMAGGSSWELRATAVRAIGRSRDLDNVPLLLFSLDDADNRVAQEAHDALRFISRKFNGFDIDLIDSEAVRESAKKHWRQWYLSIRPDARLED